VVQGAKSDQPFPNIARLVAFDKKGQSFGSCSYIGSAGDYGVIISNWHVICEADGLVHVYFPSGFSSFGAIIQFDRKWDLAVIVISKPPVSIPPLPIMQTAPRPGEPLWIAGYGSGSYRIASGYCVEYLAPEIPRNGVAPSYEIIKLSTTARQGDSGGPILNKNGELAGVLFGSDMIASTAGSHCERVKWFLKQANPIIVNLPKKPEAFFASIEPTGPRRMLSGSQQGVQRQDSLQVKNVPTTPETTPEITPVEKAALKPIINNNNNNFQNLINDTNNKINEKDKFSTSIIYDKSAKNDGNRLRDNGSKDMLIQKEQQNNLQEKFVETRPSIAEEKPIKTVEWAYNFNQLGSDANNVTKNQILPIANFQVVDDDSESKVTMAILHFDDSLKQTETMSSNQSVELLAAVDSEISAIDGNVSNENIPSDLYRVDYFRRYAVCGSVIIFSFLFYLSLRFLKSTDEVERFAVDSSIPESVVINAENICDKDRDKNSNLESSIEVGESESIKGNSAQFSHRSKHRKHAKKAA
jgi:hypothetical protein